MITQAQRAAVAALDLPFDLADSDVANQFHADGTRTGYVAPNPLARVRELSRAAMRAQAATAPTAIAA